MNLLKVFLTLVSAFVMTVTSAHAQTSNQQGTPDMTALSGQWTGQMNEFNSDSCTMRQRRSPMVRRLRQISYLL
jgi:hypothetical protein